MISPRETRLLRVPDLQSLQRQLAASACCLDAAVARATAVIVPTRAAAAELRRTFENLCLGPNAGAVAAFVLPNLPTRAEWYEQMHERLADPPGLMSVLEREVLFRAAARDAVDAGALPPFRLRPGLVVEILAFYDTLRRNHRTVDAFERLLADSLEPSVDVDRGAERLLKQTRFLAETFRAYEGRVAKTGLLDEHVLRARLIEQHASRPFRHIIVTAGDNVAEPAGLWPADFDLLARLPGLERIDVVATEGMLGAGLHDRIHDMLPGIEEVRPQIALSRRPVLVVPRDARQTDRADSKRLFFVSRDREEELVATARSVKSAAHTPVERRIDDRTAVVFQHPLPYLYLAQRVFGATGIPYQAFDALPLAAEPYAAAFDLVCEFVTSDYSRASVVALLGSPHFMFESGGQAVGPLEATALDRSLREARFMGGRARLAELASEWEAAASDPRAGVTSPQRRPAAVAARAACEAANHLHVLEDEAAPSVLLDALLEFLKRHERHDDGTDGVRERHLRAHAAVIGAIRSLRDAYARYDTRPCVFAEVAATIRRWMEEQTFTPQTGAGGVRLASAEAARYGDFDEIRIVGVVEGDWPERFGRNIFYSSSLAQQLELPADAARLRAARAAFQDLLLLPGARVSVSVFTLEDDALVAPSPLVDDLAEVGLQVEEQETELLPRRILADEALSEEPVEPLAVAGAGAALWLTLRLGRSPLAAPAFHGSIGSYRPPSCSASSVERFIECPFKYFAADVLRFPEEPDEEAVLTQVERGRFVHEVFRGFFSAWHQEKGCAIDENNFRDAQDLFARIAESHIERLPENDRWLERARLLGSEVAMGLAERVFRLEVASKVSIVERLIEFEFAGVFDFADGDTCRHVKMRGSVDRIDLLADNALRLIDYKIGRAPRRSQAVQLPVYGVCAVQELERRRGTKCELTEAGYVAFGERRLFVPIAGSGVGLNEALADGQSRFLAAIDEIERGVFPPRPRESFICSSCRYPTVCRKDYVGD